MMFSPEFHESKVYSLKNKELFSSFSAMFVYCTSVVSDDYPQVFSDALQNRFVDCLKFNFLREEMMSPQSAERFVYAWHNEGEIIKSGITTDIAYHNVKNYLHFEQLQLELGVAGDLLQRIESISDLTSPSDIIIDQLYYDAEGNYDGVSLNPTRINEDFLPDTQFSAFVSILNENDYPYDFDLITDKIVVRPRKNYRESTYSLQSDNRGEDRVLDYKKFKPKKIELDKSLTVGMYIDKIRDAWELFSDQDVQYVYDQIDHPEQEISIEVIYNLDGSLDDVLVYKCEVRDFKVWRS